MKSISILGSGESGVGAAILAKDLGYSVFVSDSKEIPATYKNTLLQENIEFEEGKHSLERILASDILIKSPGIPEKTDLMKAIRAANKYVISEIEFAFQHKGEAKIIAITGSNGKTTTTSLVYHLLKSAGQAVGLGGNIGKSFAWQVARNPQPLYVLELSSFQLDDIDTFHADVALLLNITEDHLDRYEYQLEKYAASKFKIGNRQSASDIFIYNLDDAVTGQLLPKHPQNGKMQGFSLENENAAAYKKGTFLHLNEVQYDYSTMQLVGKHNAANTLAALLAVNAVGMTEAEIKTHLPHFAPIEHRIEKVAEQSGITFINDSKATNVDSAWYALECMTQPVIWIAGGVDKGNDYSPLLPFVREKVKSLIVLGPDKDKLYATFGAQVENIAQAMSMKEAIVLARKFAVSGDAVLLSPCCASFDLFQNYEDRGRQFKACVLENA